jgi:TPR repeat protein
MTMERLITFVAIAYDLGLGVEQDAEQTFYYYQSSAEQGYAPAQFNLAEIYRDGSDAVSKNIETALYWFSLSADHGDEEAAIERDKLLKSIK